VKGRRLSNEAPASSTITARVKEADHDRLKAAAETLSSKPGKLAALLLEHSASSMASGSHRKLLTLWHRDLYNLEGRLYSCRDKLVRRADEQDLNDASQAKLVNWIQETERLYRVARLLQDLLHGLAAAQTSNKQEPLPEMLDAAEKAARKIRRAKNQGRSVSVDESRLAEYLRALGVL
jgi:hypothetical protein